MNDFIGGHTIITFLGAKYPGGAQGFTDDGGIICATPEKELFLMYHPNPPDNFLKDIKEFNKNGVTIKMVKSINFEQDTVDDITNQMGEITKKIGEELNLNRVFVAVSPLILIVTIPEVVEASVAELVAEIFLENLNGLERGYVITPEHLIPFERDEQYIPTNDNSITTKEIVEPAKRITDDDILNLKISLNQDMDVNDFINSL